MKAEMPISRLIKRILTVVTRSCWMKSNQESLPTFGLKMYAELVRTRKDKRLGIKSPNGNKIGFMDDGSVFLREASSDAYSARYGGCEEECPIAA